MKVFIKVDAIFAGTSKKAARSFRFDINGDLENLTIADIKTEARKQFKNHDLIEESIVSEKVEFGRKDDHEDSIKVIDVAGKCPDITYKIEIALPAEAPRERKALAASKVNATKKSIAKPSRKQSKQD